MEQLKVLEFLDKNEDYLFPNKSFTYEMVEQELLNAPESAIITMNSIPFKKPTLMFVLSLITGTIGVDRFYLEDYVKGLIKLVTYGGCYIWYAIDIITAKKRCREYNCRKLMASINDPSVAAKMNTNNAKFQHAVNIAKAAAPAVKDLKKSIGDLTDTFDNKY